MNKTDSVCHQALYPFKCQVASTRREQSGFLRIRVNLLPVEPLNCGRIPLSALCWRTQQAYLPACSLFRSDCIRCDAKRS